MSDSKPAVAHRWAGFFLRVFLGSVLVCGIAATPLSAQAPLRTGPAFPATSFHSHSGPVPAAIPAEGDRDGAVFVGALGGSVLGTLVGGATAVWLDDTSFDLGDYLLGVLVGATVGSSVGAALGADLADGEGGSFGKRLLVATLVGGAGIGLAAGAEDGRVLFAIPVLQSIAMVVGDYR